MNAPHQLNESLIQKSITDNSHDWQEKCSVSAARGQDHTAHTGHGITVCMELSCSGLPAVRKTFSMSGLRL